MSDTVPPIQPRRLPMIAVLLGVVGLIPFIFCGLASLNQDEVYARNMMWALMSYGAVVLSFLGGVHWGFALDTRSLAQQGGKVENWRLLFGVLPPLIGWVALLASIALPAAVAIGILIAGFLATVIVEHQASQRGYVPRPYMWLRWGLSLAVVAMLVTVLTLRLLGQHLLL